MSVDPGFVPSLLNKAQSGPYAMVIGSRFLPPKRALEGGMPRWKFVCNRILTFFNNALLGVRLSDVSDQLSDPVEVQRARVFGGDQGAGVLPEQAVICREDVDVDRPGDLAQRGVVREAP